MSESVRKSRNPKKIVLNIEDNQDIANRKKLNKFCKRLWLMWSAQKKSIILDQTHEEDRLVGDIWKKRSPQLKKCLKNQFKKKKLNLLGILLLNFCDNRAIIHRSHRAFSSFTQQHVSFTLCLLIPSSHSQKKKNPQNTKHIAWNCMSQIRLNISMHTSWHMTWIIYLICAEVRTKSMFVTCFVQDFFKHHHSFS